MKKNTSLLSLLVFLLFALCLLLVLLTGARAYRQTLSKTEDASDTRTKVHYLSTRVQQAQEIAVESFGGCQALVLREEIEGDTYVTYIYCHGGWLRELFCAEGANLTPQDGELVTEADSLTCSLDEGLLTLQIDGETLYFSPSIDRQGW